MIDYVTFDADKCYDTGVYGNDKTTLEMEFQRTNISGAHYLFGCSSGNRMTGYLTSSGYWRYGSGYPTFNTNNTTRTTATVTPGKTTVGTTSRTFSFTSPFTTPFTIPVGGHKPASGVATPQFRGMLYYFRIIIDGVTMVDWMPCRRKSDGVEGFWDNVTNSFVAPI